MNTVRFPEDVAECIGRNANGRMIGIDHQAPGEALSTRTSARGSLWEHSSPPIRGKRGDHFLGIILIGDEPDADLCRGGGGNHGLGASRGEAAGDAVNLKRRPRPDALEHRTFRLAG